MHWIADVRQVVFTERALLGIEGRPTLNDTHRLIDAHPELTICWEIGISAHLRINGETGRIYLDPRLSDAERNFALLEETGHFLLRHLSYRQSNLRDYLLGDGKHENPAGAFSLLWRFTGVDVDTDEDLMAEGDYSPDEVTRFRQLQLRG